MKTVLTIAGSDCSGGAGIQADIKTMIMNGVYAMSAVTALTAQNTVGVSGIFEVTPEFLEKQLDAVFTDIRPDAVKIGMVPTADLIRVTARKLRSYSAGRIVVDPVMVSTSGSDLIRREAVKELREQLLPLAALVTPNLPEAAELAQMPVRDSGDMERAAERIRATSGCPVLLKGGHSAGGADDLLCTEDGLLWLRASRIDNPNTHGTGCTLSSAIAANLAKGYGLLPAVKRAKEYISGALGAMLDLGRGNGPLDHAFCRGGEFF